MAADRARRSFDATRLYRSVVAQQGRVTLEADVNEAEEIRIEASRAQLSDLIGATGALGDGFKITVAVPPPVAGGSPAWRDFDFAIGEGTLYVGGERVHTVATTYFQQQGSEWLDDPAGPPVEAQVDTTVPFRELIYLSVTEQEVTAIEDLSLIHISEPTRLLSI